MVLRDNLDRMGILRGREQRLAGAAPTLLGASVAPPRSTEVVSPLHLLHDGPGHAPCDRPGGGLGRACARIFKASVQPRMGMNLSE